MVFSISLEVKKNIKCKGKRVGDYLYDKETDTIYYELPYPFPCKFAVIGLKKIIVTPAMLHLPTFLKYHNIDWLRQQLLQVHLIQNDCLLLHGSAWWGKNNQGYLAVGFPDSGKTTRVLKEVKQGAKFCSDENIIISKTLWCYPVERKTSLSYWLAKEVKYPLTLRQKLSYIPIRLRHKLCPLFEPNIWVDLPFTRYDFKLHHLIYLTEGEGKSLRLLTDNEFPFYTNPVIQSYCYATGLNLDEIYNKYKNLISEVGKCSL